ncbi:MAG: hypothetical protein AB7F86_04720 [Bdellovibrionales bacterium]
MKNSIAFISILAFWIQGHTQELSRQEPEVQAPEIVELYAFGDLESGWVQAHFYRENEEAWLEFETEGDLPGRQLLVTVEKANIEMELVVLELDNSQVPRAYFLMDPGLWPMDFPRDLDGKTIIRFRDFSTDQIVFEGPLAPEF